MEGAGCSPSLNAAPVTLVQLQAQLALQQDHLLRQEQMMAQFQTQLNDANTRMLRAEEERNLALKLAARKSGQDFSEWSQMFKTFCQGQVR